MYFFIENMSTAQTAEQAKVPDCAHEHFKDLGIEELGAVVRRETDDGEQIEIQEDWSEFSRYRPKRPEPSIWQLVLERMRSQAQQDSESQEPSESQEDPESQQPPDP